MGAGLIVEICHVIIALSTQIYLSSVAYCLYLVATEWLGYYLLLFSLDYIGEPDHPLLKKNIMISLIMLDSASLVLNMFTGHLFTLKKCIEGGDFFWYVMELKPAFFTHLTWAYIIILMSVFCMVYKTFLSAAIYRKKFFFMLVVMTAVGFFDGCYIFYGWEFNLSVPLYTVVAAVLYYFCIRYIPKGLINNTMGLVVDKSVYGIVIEEDDGRRIFSNASAKNFLAKTPELNMIIENWRISNQYEKMDVRQIHNYLDTEDGERIYYDMKFNRITDKEGNYIGNLYMLKDETKDVIKREQERYNTMHDPLTGLYRKDYFYIRVKEELEAFPDKDYLLLGIDIYRFRLINKLFGQEAGDEVLRFVASLFKEYAIKGYVYGYLGADRFALLMPAERFSMNMFNKERVNEIKLAKEYAYNIRFYAGIYRINDKNVNPQVMCDNAFAAIQTIKGSRDRVVAFYDETVTEDMLQAQNIETEIYDAIETGQIGLIVEPQTDSAGDIKGGEISACWMHPEKGLITESGFVPVLEEKGLTYRLDRYVWEKACVYLRRWIDMGRDDLFLALKISTKDLYMMDSFEVITELCEKYEIPSKNIKVTISEDSVMTEVDRQADVIKRFQGYGIDVAMSDFGTGESSLRLLKYATLNVLKLDIGFLGNADDERARSILTAMIQMSKELGITVACKGVETYDQMKFLKRVGCDIFSGNFFSKSMEIARFEDMYLNE